MADSEAPPRPRTLVEYLAAIEALATEPVQRADDPPYETLLRLAQRLGTIAAYARLAREDLGG